MITINAKPFFGKKSLNVRNVKLFSNFFSTFFYFFDAFLFSTFMSGSCHLERASNDEFSVEFLF